MFIYSTVYVNIIFLRCITELYITVFTFLNHVYWSVYGAYDVKCLFNYQISIHFSLKISPL